MLKTEFDYIDYINTNKDLQDAGINTLDKAYSHYMIHGRKEGRKAKKLESNNHIKPINPINPIKTINPIKHIYPMSHILSANKTEHTHIKNKGENIKAINPINPINPITHITPTGLIKPKPFVETLKYRSETVKQNSIKTLSSPKTILKHKIALLLYVFNVELLDYFLVKIKTMYNKYSNSSECIHLYVCVCNLENPFILKENMNTDEKLINYIKGKITSSISDISNVVIGLPNKGGDIGSLLCLNKITFDNPINNTKYNFYYILHTKTNMLWRNTLCDKIFSVDINTCSNNVGMIGANRYCLLFKHKTKYRYHLDKLVKLYDINEPSTWYFIGGTIFIANSVIMEKIAKTNFSDVYDLFNTVETVDENWLNNLKIGNIDPKNCRNDFEHRLKFKKPLLSDYMFEHTYERFFGLLLHWSKLEFKKIV